MNEKELLNLGFKDTSYSEFGNEFSEFTLIHDEGFTIQILGLNYTEIRLKNEWIEVPSCKNVTDVVKLIELFKLPF
jgi:hypothetical protein